MKFPNIQQQYKLLKKDIDRAVLNVLAKGQFVLGEEGRKLEEEVAKFIGAKYAVGVNSGTDALFFALKSLIGKGDEVITTPFTFVATAEAIIRTGANLVFVDIGEDELIDAKRIESSITRRTKAILPVHLFDNSCDMKTIKCIAKEYSLEVVEDMAQSFGLPLRGDVGCLSFHPTKKLGAYGDGGMVITNSRKIADKIKLLRNHGSSPKNKYYYKELGYNSRLDEIQAAILRVKLKHYDIRPTIERPNIYYPRPLHLQPAFKFLGYVKGDFPTAEKIAKQRI